MATQLPLALVPERREPTTRERADRQGVIEEKKKLRAMAGSAAKERNARYREICREAAREIAARDGDVDIDRVRFHLEEKGVELPWGGWAGSVFAPKEWKWTGDWVPCKHEGSRARPVRVWRRVTEPSAAAGDLS